MLTFQPRVDEEKSHPLTAKMQSRRKKTETGSPRLQNRLPGCALLFQMPGFPESIGPFTGQRMIPQAGIGNAECTGGFGHGLQIMVRERLGVLILQSLQKEAYA